MKARDILELFICGSLDGERICKVTIDDDTDIKMLCGAVDNIPVQSGTYIIYYEPITNQNGHPIAPNYILHDEDGNELFFLKIDGENVSNELEDKKHEFLMNLLTERQLDAYSLYCDSLDNK